MARALRVCPTPGCPELTTGGQCPDCRRDADRDRGSAADRGYGRAHTSRFRRGVLDRDPVCTIRVRCNGAPSTVADHWPLSRRELVAAGEDPDDPRHGRGACHSCHSAETAATPTQQGGWNRRA